MLTASLIKWLRKIGPRTYVVTSDYILRSSFGVPISGFSVLSAPCFYTSGTLVNTGEWLVTCIRIML